MRLIFKFSLFILIILVSSNCSKDPVVDLTQDIPLSAEDENHLASVRDTIIHIEDVILENGMDVKSFLKAYDPDFVVGTDPGTRSGKEERRPVYQKFTFIARMFINGEYLVTDANHTFLKDGDDGPAQTGLAYSYGSKIYNQRLVPPAGGCRNLRIYGLDCSGTIRVMTLNSGLEFAGLTNYDVASFSSTVAWDNAFKASSDFKDLKMKDMGKLAEGEMKNGDVVLWSKHMGIYLYGFLYQSNGTSESPGCEYNLGVDKGPRLISFSEIISWRGFSNNYKILRVDSGDDYMLTTSVNFSGYPTTPTGVFVCKMGTYIENTLINITIKDGFAILNYINNSDPAVTFQSGLNCTCKSVSFSAKSMIDFTDFDGFIDSNGDLNFNITYTQRAPKMVYNCGGLSPDLTTEEIVSANMIAVGKIAMPNENEPVKETTVPIWSGGNVKITKDL